MHHKGKQQNQQGPRDHEPAFINRISVPFEYPVYFTRGVTEVENSLLCDTFGRLAEERRHRAAVYVDSGVADTHPGLIDQIKEYFHRYSDRIELTATPEIIPGGEVAKNNWKSVQDVMFAIGNLHLDRQSFIIGIGGGSLLDMVGFAASIVHRGLRLIRIPTTTLAQCDSGVGVKNSMNEHGQKNFVGTFAPPFAVLNDYDFLPTLSQQHWIGGVAEAFKVALIKDAPFFDFLCRNAKSLASRDAVVMEEVIRRCAIIHLEHISTSGDPFEFGSARPLDFGHWAGHKLETLTGYQLGHGQCVSIGIGLDSYYAMRHDLISEMELERILSALDECGLPTWSDHLAAWEKVDSLIVNEALEQFREHLGGILNVTLPAGIGRRSEVHHMDRSIIQEGLRFLGKRASRSSHE